MRKGMLILIVLLDLCTVQAQLPAPKWSEFFNQTKKQRQRMMEQIALLQVYIEVLKKGYRIVEDGLQLINDIKQGDFSMHNGYFASLKTVNPDIKKYSKVNDITRLYDDIATLYIQSTKIASGTVFTNEERSAVERIFSGLLTQANNNLKQLKTLTTPGNFELTDDERLKRIEVLWADMRDKYAFAKDFKHSIALLQVQKQREERDARGMNRMSE